MPVIGTAPAIMFSSLVKRYEVDYSIDEAFVAASQTLTLGDFVTKNGNGELVKLLSGGGAATVVGIALSNHEGQSFTAGERMTFLARHAVLDGKYLATIADLTATTRATLLATLNDIGIVVENVNEMAVVPEG